MCSFALTILCCTLWASDLPDPIPVEEHFVTPSRYSDNLDSIAIYAGKKRHLAIVTAKASDRLLIYDADTGQAVGEIGGRGEGEGQFRRPNGVRVFENLLFVVERDNHRVQVLSLPDLKFVAFIGTELLRKPYGLDVYRAADQSLHLYITDDYDAESSEVPEDFYTMRIKHFQLTNKDQGLESKFLGNFGDANGPGRLFKVESILADPAHDRLFICDEKGDSVGIKLYDLNGKFSGKTLDAVQFDGEPEGVALFATGPKTGYLIATDQQPTVSLFHVFDRESLAYKGTFRGKTTANTDGITVHASPVGEMHSGALWAIHDDQSLACFDWQKIKPHLR